MQRHLVLLLAVLASGCTGPDTAPPEPNTSAPLVAVILEPVVHSIAVSVPVSAGTPVTSAQYSNPNGGNVPVPPNATIIVVEAHWTCTTPTCSYALAARNPTGRAVATSDGTGNARLEVETPVDGDWNVALFGTAASAGMEGEVRTTIFFGPVPEGYTAFGVT